MHAVAQKMQALSLHVARIREVLRIAKKGHVSAMRGATRSLDICERADISWMRDRWRDLLEPVSVCATNCIAQPSHFRSIRMRDIAGYILSSIYLRPFVTGPVCTQ